MITMIMVKDCGRSGSFYVSMKYTQKKTREMMNYDQARGEIEQEGSYDDTTEKPCSTVRMRNKGVVLRFFIRFVKECVASVSLFLFDFMLLLPIYSLYCLCQSCTRLLLVSLLQGLLPNHGCLGNIQASCSCIFFRVGFGCHSSCRAGSE